MGGVCFLNCFLVLELKALNTCGVITSGPPSKVAQMFTVLP